MGSWSRVEVEGGGDQRAGALRVLVNRPFRVREWITEWEPRERIGYELLKGMRVRGYRSFATIDDDRLGIALFISACRRVVVRTDFSERPDGFRRGRREAVNDKGVT